MPNLLFPKKVVTDRIIRPATLTHVLLACYVTRGASMTLGTPYKGLLVVSGLRLNMLKVVGTLLCRSSVSSVLGLTILVWVAPMNRAFGCNVLRPPVATTLWAELSNGTRMSIMLEPETNLPTLLIGAIPRPLNIRVGMREPYVDIPTLKVPVTLVMARLTLLSLTTLSPPLNSLKLLVLL